MKGENQIGDSFEGKFNNKNFRYIFCGQLLLKESQ